MEKRPRDIRRPPVPIFNTKKSCANLLAHPNNRKNHNDVSPSAYSVSGNLPCDSTSHQWSSIQKANWQNQQNTQKPIWQQQQLQPSNQYTQKPIWQQQQQQQSLQQPSNQNHSWQIQQSNQDMGLNMEWQEQVQQSYNQSSIQSWQNPMHQTMLNTSNFWQEQELNVQRQGTSFANSSNNQRRQNQWQSGLGYSDGQIQNNRPGQYQGQQELQQRGPFNGESRQHNPANPYPHKQNMAAGDYSTWGNTDISSPRQLEQPGGHGNYQTNSMYGKQGQGQTNIPASSPRYGQTPVKNMRYGQKKVSTTPQLWGMATGAHDSSLTDSMNSSLPDKTQTAGAGSTMPKEEAHTVVKTGPDKSLKVLTATVQGMKHWAKYKDKTAIIFELIGRMDSAVTADSQFGCREFMLKDDKANSVRCVFYEIDRTFSKLVRGQYYRCVGTYDTDKKRVRCVSVRAATNPERKLHRAFVAACDRAMRDWTSSVRET